MIVRLLVTLALLAGCAPAQEETLDDLALAAELRPFEDCAALSERIRTHALDHVGPYGLPGGAGGMGPVAVPDARDGAVRLGAEAAVESGAAGGAAADAAAVPAAPSGTNVQVAGVDEGDLAKTDGAYLYTVTDSALRVVDVRAAQPRVVATLTLDDGVAGELLLDGDRLLVIGQATFEPAAAPGTERLTVPDFQRTRLWMVDIATPDDPRVLSSMTLEGAVAASRLAEGVARVVVRSWMAPRDLVVPQSAGRGAEQRALAVNQERIRQADLTTWLPRAEVDGGAPQPLVECGAVHAPRRFAELGMVTLLSLDMRDAALTREHAEAVIGAAETVYATSERLYVTTSPWPWLLPGPLPVEPMPMPIDPPAAEPLTDPAAPRSGATTPGGAAAEVAPDAGAAVEVAPDAGAPDAGAAVEVAPAAPAEAPAMKPTDMPTEPLARPTADELPPDVPPAPAPDELPSDVPPDVPPAPLPDVSPVPLPEPQAPEEPRTEVHRFDLDGLGATYVASGAVPGVPLNQWALSEHDGDLRIATTEDDFSGGGNSHSAVRVLRERDGELREIGHVGDLGRGERIHAVRYLGDIGFVVTFRQIDPLYAIDLSDPTAPRVLGELKIPGYSAYLHPVGDDQLLGVGQDAAADGRTLGAQVSLFDVADLSAPRRVDTLGLGKQSMAPVEVDHRAFLYDPDEGVAVVPVESWGTGTVGAAVIEVGPGELRERGTVAHDPQGGAPAAVQRAFVIADRLVTLTPFGVRSSDLRTLDVLGDAPFGG